MNRKYLAVVTARGGSKGIPNKNIKLLNGLPLIEYTIEAGKIAQKEGFLSRLIVSTDSEEIAHVSVECGAEVPFLRPKELGLDNTKSVDVILDVLEKMEKQGERFDAIITLQPTSPLRTGEDICSAIKQFDISYADSLIGVYEEPKANGYGYYHMGDNGLGLPFHKEHNRGVRRQDMKPVYVRNGAIYISSVQLLHTKRLIIGDHPLLYVMPAERSIDIDQIRDFEYVDWIIKQHF